MSFVELPVELHLQIADCLPRAAASCLSRTSRRFHSLLLRRVYDDITWLWETQNAQCEKGHASPPIHLLTRSLVERPELGRYVQHISFDEYPQNRNEARPKTVWANHESACLTEKDLQKMTDFIQTSNTEPMDLFKTALTEGQIDAFTTLTLMLCPDLQSLNLGRAFNLFKDTFFGNILWQSVIAAQELGNTDSRCDLPSQYSALQTVCLSREDYFKARPKAQVDFLCFYAFLYLPELVDFSAELLRARDPPLQTSIQRAPMANLTSLKLPFCQANPDTLEFILSSKPPLQTLVYEYCCAVDCSYYWAYFINLDLISLALSHVASTLQNLTISIEHLTPDVEEIPCYEKPRGIFDSEHGRLASFRDFPKLQYLEAGFTLLVDWEFRERDIWLLQDMLPRNLHHLCVTDNLLDWSDWRTKHVVQQMKYVLGEGSYENSFEERPCRKSLEIIEYQQRRWGTSKAQDAKDADLIELGKKHGVEVRWIHRDRRWMCA